MKTNLAELYLVNPLSACKKALVATRNENWKTRLDTISRLLGLHGTDCINGEWQNGYWCDIVATYCNTGDSYGITVIHLRGDGWNESGRFFVGSIGDFIERNGTKYGIL